MIIVACFLAENKSISLKPLIELSILQLSFVNEAYLKTLMLLNLESYLLKEIRSNFSDDYNVIDKSDAEYISNNNIKLKMIIENCLDKIYNIFQTTRFNHTIIFFNVN